MDPLPSINRTFSLIVQGEKQKSIHNDVHHSIVFVAKASTQNRGKPQNNFKNNNHDRPFCTHCKLQGHMIDKCHKLHIYPLGYKSKSRVAAAASHDDPNVQMSSINNDLSKMFKGVSQEQCQQIMSALSNHMISVNPDEETTIGNVIPFLLIQGKNHRNG